MDKVEALRTIAEAWADSDAPLDRRVRIISEAFYSAGLDLAKTAAYIHATPAELDCLIALGALDDDALEKLSSISPPKTVWIMLANASDKEFSSALEAMRAHGESASSSTTIQSYTEYVYSMMQDASEPDEFDRVGMLTGNAISQMAKRGEQFNALNDWSKKFLKSVAAQKKRGKNLSAKQTSKLKEILEDLVDREVIIRGGVDGDAEMCAEVLDALGR